MIYIYLHGKGISDTDFSTPESGNPGVGGTQYCILLLAYYLSNGYSKDIVLLSQEDINCPDSIKTRVVKDLSEICDLMTSEDILICKTPNDIEAYRLFKESNGRIICWSHNYFNSKIACQIYKTKNIIANVFVSKQMYDFYIDNDIINKSCYIYNIVPDILGECVRSRRRNTLVFQGNLVKEKGIIDLFKIWSLVEKECPQANLYVIGKSNLYDHSEKLGKTGILSAKLEKALSPYIFTQERTLKPNIHFLGILGKEKYDIFLHSSVGIVNPSGKTETFGLGIVEMATAKLPVVTINWNGHPDVAVNKQSALLGYTHKQMANNIIRLFENEKLNEMMGNTGKELSKRFAPEYITKDWIKLIDNINHNNYRAERLKITRPYSNNYKFIRQFNSYLRFNLRLRFLPSVVQVETALNNLIKFIRKRV